MKRKMMRRWWLRFRMKRALDAGKRLCMEDAAPLWALSDIIYLGPVGPSATRLPEFFVYVRIADDPSISDVSVFQWLGHESASVAGYALEILIRRRSDCVAEAVKALQGRKEEVSMGFTCFCNYRPLAEYAVCRSESV